MKYLIPHYYPHPDYYKYAKKTHPKYGLYHISYEPLPEDNEKLRDFIKKINPKIIFNIGVGYGLIEVQICETLLRDKNFFKIYSIDPWLGTWDSVTMYDNRFSADEEFNAFLFNIKSKDLNNYVIPCRHTPLTWFTKLKGSREFPDFIYINALRFTWQEVKLIIELYSSILSKTGAICLFHKNYDEIKKFITVFAKENNFKITDHNNLCFLQK
jgi:hypothetical protein